MKYLNNNKFWGNGFTEWWNVKKTYQIHNKHLPLTPHNDIGYYNILNKTTQQRWNNYSDKFNFDIFSFYHYWFENGIIMEKPLLKILENNLIKKPWFLIWANENWTKRWDGGNNEILLKLDLNLKL